MKKKILITIPAIVMIIMGILTAMHIYDTRYYEHRGRVLDVDTKQPIEGMVVLAKWTTERASIAEGGWGRGDVKETLTDKNGEWRIQGPKGDDPGSGILAIITGLCTGFRGGTSVVLPPEFIYFKPGYCPAPDKVGIEACIGKGKGYLVGDAWTLELPKLTNKEDRRKALPGRVSGRNIDENKMIFFRMINEESRALGLGEYKY